jgi:hypothetical protein
MVRKAGDSSAYTCTILCTRKRDVRVRIATAFQYDPVQTLTSSYIGVRVNGFAAWSWYVLMPDWDYPRTPHECLTLQCRQWQYRCLLDVPISIISILSTIYIYITYYIYNIYIISILSISILYIYIIYIYILTKPMLVQCPVAWVTAGQWTAALARDRPLRELGGGMKVLCSPTQPHHHGAGGVEGLVHTHTY